MSHKIPRFRMQYVGQEKEVRFVCAECLGDEAESQTCQTCGGKYLRDWSDLPTEVQSRWTERWELFGNPLSHFQVAAVRK